MSEVQEIATILSMSSAAGVTPAPLIVAGIRSFFRSNTKRNLLRTVRARLIEDRPAPGDDDSLKAIYNQLCGFMVDPDYLAAMTAYAERGSFAALETVRGHINAHLDVPDGGDRVALLDLIENALIDGLAAAQKNPQAATGVATRAHADRVIGKVEEGHRSLEAGLSALDERFASLSAALQPRIFDLGELASWTRKTMKALSKSDPPGWSWLVTQLGDPPSSERVLTLIDAWPPELQTGSTDLLFAVVRHAEAVGGWDKASAAWQHLAERAEGPDRADHYARAAIDAGMAGHAARRQDMLTASLEADPACVRAALEALDENLEPAAKLKALEGLRSDDIPLACLLECYRAREYLVLYRLDDAEDHLVEARALSGDEVGVRVAEINLTVQWARRALRKRRPSSAEKLRAAQAAALELREELLPMRRFDETVRLLMLAAEVEGFLFDYPAMAQRLREATEEELGSPDGPTVLADAALRADDVVLAHAFALAGGDAPACRRVRAALAAANPNAPDRVSALDGLTTMALGGGEESTLAALARLQGGAIRPQAVWDPRVADVLVRDGHESVAVGLHVETYLRADRPIAAWMLLEGRPDEAWVAELRVRIMGYRRRIVALVEAAEALLRHSPGPAGRLLAARAFAQAGCLDPARQEFTDIARDPSAPPLLRSDAYNMLVDILGRQRRWDAAQDAIEDWQRLANEERLWDDRINAARPHVGSGRAALVAGG
jgi:tetratricopeptide (TPR) repeat protein